jgi:hypothetical protein
LRLKIAFAAQHIDESLGRLRSGEFLRYEHSRHGLESRPADKEGGAVQP